MSSLRPPERRQLTVMMCDVAGWTALSLRLDPEELAEVIQAYRTLCGGVVTRHGGVVAQYVGDGVLAWFGYPRAHEDDAERAIRAALAIVAEARLPASGSGESGVHIGISTGVVVVGSLAAGTGSDGPEEISAVGSALNLAARLQGLAVPGTVVVSEETRRLARGVFDYADLGRHRLKGADEPVQAWQVLRESRARSRFHALRAASLTPLVGRQAELARLETLWASARAGQGSAVLLSAEPGVGKSRLAEEAASRIVGRRGMRLWFFCAPHLQSSPLAPLIRQLTLAAGLRDKDDDDTKLRKLERLFPGGAEGHGETMALLANLLALRSGERYPPLAMSPQRQKQRLFQCLMARLEAMAARAPVLLVVEDLHWIDPSSDELVGILLERLPALPLLAIFTARPEFQFHWEGRLLTLPLSPLARDDALAMIGHICGERRLPPAAVGKIVDETDGLPLFIEDLTRDVLELADQQQGALSGALPFAIPTTLNDSLMSRLDRLGSAKAVAQVGAVIGREFSYELLARVADMSEEHLKEELYRLVNAGLLVSRRATAVLMYAFQHALVRDAAYASLLKKAQAALHARIARVLEEDFPEAADTQPEILAHHFRAAGQAGRAVHYLVKAAKLSARRSGFVEAVAQLEAALQLIAPQAESREAMQQALRVHLALGGINAEFRGFSAAQCGAAYRRALELCRALGDAPEIFAVLSGVGAFEITRANFAECHALAEECLARAALQSARPPFIMGHLLEGGTLFLSGEFAAARAHLEEAIGTYEQDQGAQRGRQVLYVQDQKSTGLCYLALTLTILGRLQEGLEAARRGLRHSEALGGLHTINYSLCYLAAVLHIRGDFEAAREQATRSLALAREQRFATWIGISQLVRGAALAAGGRTEEGLKEISAGMAAHEAMEAVTYRAYGLSILGQALILAGHHGEALEALERGAALAERSGDCFYLAELLRLKGEACAGLGQPEEAARSLREAIDLARSQQARLFELRSAVALCRLLEGPAREAALGDILAPAYSWFEEPVPTADMAAAAVLLAGDKHQD